MSSKFLFGRKDKDKVNNNKNHSNQNNNNHVNTSTNNGNGEDVQDFSERRAKLTPVEYRVTQEKETERPFSNRYYKHWETGSYHCIVCDAELFTSTTKFESKSGWPAFYNVVDPKRVKLKQDLSHIGANLLLLISKPDLARTEVSCANCSAHIGHLFKDGPKPTGLRYCVNSAALNFVPGSSTGNSNSTDGIDVKSGNENGGLQSPSSEKIPEFACNPENMCSLNNSVQAQKARFFSSSDGDMLALPPMGSLCLSNNQQCQRVKVTTKKSEPEKPPRSRQNEIIQKTKEIPPPPPPKPKNNSGNDFNFMIPSDFPVFEKCTNYKKNKNSMEAEMSKEESPPKSNTSPTKPSFLQRSSSARYSSSNGKGASLTAARIQFFQNLDNQTKVTDTPVPSSTSIPFKNRFVTSNSSGSIGLKNNINGRTDSPEVTMTKTERRGSGPGPFGFVISQQISCVPMPMKETEL